MGVCTAAAAAAAAVVGAALVAATVATAPPLTVAAAPPPVSARTNDGRRGGWSRVNVVYLRRRVQPTCAALPRREPRAGGFFAIANRGGGTLTLVDADRGAVVDQLHPPAGGGTHVCGHALRELRGVGGGQGTQPTGAFFRSFLCLRTTFLTPLPLGPTPPAAHAHPFGVSEEVMGAAAWPGSHWSRCLPLQAPVNCQ